MSNAIDFLTSLPGAIADVTAIHPTTGKIWGRSYNVKGNANDRAACAKWIASATGKGYGTYFNVNSLGIRLGFDKYPKGHKREGQPIQKAAREDVTTLHAFHVDADAPKDIRDPQAFANAKAKLLRSIEGMNRPPTIIIDSGNGYGLFWVLRKSVKVTAANLDQLTGINITLRDAVPGAADACQNLDRVMRLPYTTNFPNATKIARGRVEVATDLITTEWRELGALYSVEDFEAAPVETISPPTAPDEAIDIPDTVDLARLDKDLRKLVENGPPKGKKIGDGSRSAHSFMVTCALVKLGFTDGEIVAVLINPDYKVSAHVLDQKQRTPEQTAMKMIRDARARGARTAMDDFEADPIELLTPEQEAEQEDIKQRNARTKPLELGKRRRVEIFASELVTAMDKVQRIVGPQTDRPDPIFKRNGRLVHLSRNLTDEGIKLKHFERDALIILDATKHWAANRFEKSIQFVIPNGEDDNGKTVWKPINCPLGMVDRILGDSTNWNAYPSLYSTVETPTLRKDGTILDRPGYDVETGLFYDPGDVKFSPIKNNPTVEQGKIAIAKIDELLVDFPFADDVSKAVAMSLMLSSVVRRSMDTAPIYGIDADDAEAGKTTLAKVGGALATGRDIQVQAYAKDIAERDKLLPALLLGGSPYLLFDNLPDGCIIEGAEIEKVVTSAIYESRPFGKNDTTRVMPTNATMVFNGNKIGAKGAMTTRMLIVRLVPDKPYAERTFTHPAIVAHTIKVRPLLVAAILTALRAYLVHGGEVERDRDRFPDWSKLIRSALLWYGYADPLRGGDKLRVDDPVKEAQREFARAWWRKFEDRSVLARELVFENETRTALAEGLDVQARDVSAKKAGRYIVGMVDVRLDLPVDVIAYQVRGEPARFSLKLKPSGRGNWADEHPDMSADVEADAEDFE